MCIVDSVAEPSFKVKRCRGPVGASVSFSAGSVSAPRAQQGHGLAASPAFLVQDGGKVSK